MDMLKGLVREFWQWVPKLQFYGVLGLTVVLWLVRKYALSQLVLIVAALAWVLGFAVSRSDMAAGLGSTAVHLGMLVMGAAVVFVFWFVFLRNP
jgi:hypothetical protein